MIGPERSLSLGILSMDDLSIEKLTEIPNEATPGLSHISWLVWIDRTGLPAWQIGITSFLILVIVGISTLILTRVPDPSMYSKVIAFATGLLPDKSGFTGILFTSCSLS